MTVDLFPTFDRRWIEVNGVKIFTRTSGQGRPLLLLHGHPQTHVIWHKVAQQLAQKHTVVMTDLRGYGDSDLA
jgi:haloacetate dehalogenase